MAANTLDLSTFAACTSDPVDILPLTLFALPRGGTGGDGGAMSGAGAATFGILALLVGA